MNRLNKKIKQLDMGNKYKKIFKINNALNEMKYSDTVDVLNENNILELMSILTLGGIKQHELDVCNTMSVPLKLRNKYGKQ
jgi:hypothetical protein